jgi:hypothetical protein
MDLHLEPQEASLLVRVARARLTELRQELHHTKDAESREYLRHKERILQNIIAKFPTIDERAHMVGFVKPG